MDEPTEELLTGRDLVRAFMVTLPLLEAAAKRERNRKRAVIRVNRRIEDFRTRYGVDEDRAWTLLLLEDRHMRQLSRAARKARLKREWAQYVEDMRPKTQAELRALASKAHWADVIYKGGTDIIVHVRRPPW